MYRIKDYAFKFWLYDNADFSSDSGHNFLWGGKNVYD